MTELGSFYTREISFTYPNIYNLYIFVSSAHPHICISAHL